MAAPFLISNERSAREAAATIARLDEVLSSEHILRSIMEGLPPEVVGGVRNALLLERKELSDAVFAYQSTKTGNFQQLAEKAGNDPGATLIVARIALGLSQKDLARKLGLREQAIQRYEAERYRSISLSNYQKVAGVLGVRVIPEFKMERSGDWQFSYDVDKQTMMKVLKHARDRGWLEKGSASDDDAFGLLIRHVGDHVVRHGMPSLHRTGMRVVDASQDWPTLAWKAHVTQRAEAIISQGMPRYDALEISWLRTLVELSTRDDGPSAARDFLLDKGVALIIEPQIPGMSLDGAAFLVDEVPVIGMTLLRDSLDNFWFTLLHELAHIILHFRKGLAAGFFDDFDNHDPIELEQEADIFAGNMFIPDELWRRSPARIARTPEPLSELARQLRIHQAIVFGRVRMERGDYSIFSDRIGRGTVRRQLLSGQQAR